MEYHQCCETPNIQKNQNANRDKWLQCNNCDHSTNLPAYASEGEYIAIWNEDFKPTYEELAAKVAELEGELDVFHCIVSESQGVAGYHLNGDIATWDELLQC
ncbi:hypothetical protein [Alteromonas gilva]|uniref:Uncharacterized protein n=1 Tax=Alteromonas gilva TaxID=2987522 RepID=A0ABT5L9R2_9ALTE|nr:hypothetical protein [Alteromonas gilva]MDC8832823.1 hypothetical protein [Alteromonas gilva]